MALSDYHAESQISEGSRYRRQRKFLSLWGLFFGLLLGTISAFLFARYVDTVREFDTVPRQLRAQDKAHYVVAILLNYNNDSNLSVAVNRLIALDLGNDPIQAVAEVACDLARSNYVSSNSGIRAVQIMKTFYQNQGRSGCADELVIDVQGASTARPLVTIQVPTQVPTLPPPPSKTPLVDETIASATPNRIFAPTVIPQSNYVGQIAGTFCNSDLSGLIEVFVQDFSGDGIAGQRIRVRWDDGQDIFVSGLKPERGPAYADFQMEAGKNYIIDMPGQSDPISTPIAANQCFLEGGGTAITSYRIVFRLSG